jgi:hypothetical protein
MTWADNITSAHSGIPRCEWENIWRKDVHIITCKPIWRKDVHIIKPSEKIFKFVGRYVVNWHSQMVMLGLKHRAHQNPYCRGYCRLVEILQNLQRMSLQFHWIHEQVPGDTNVTSSLNFIKLFQPPQQNMPRKRPTVIIFSKTQKHVEPPHFLFGSNIWHFTDQARRDISPRDIGTRLWGY